MRPSDDALAASWRVRITETKYSSDIDSVKLGAAQPFAIRSFFRARSSVKAREVVAAVVLPRVELDRDLQLGIREVDPNLLAVEDHPELLTRRRKAGRGERAQAPESRDRCHRGRSQGAGRRAPHAPSTSTGPGPAASRSAQRRKSSRTMRSRRIASSSTRPSQRTVSRDDTSISARSAVTVGMPRCSVRSLSNSAPDRRPRTPSSRDREPSVGDELELLGLVETLEAPEVGGGARVTPTSSHPYASTLASSIWCHDGRCSSDRVDRRSNLDPDAPAAGGRGSAPSVNPAVSAWARVMSPYWAWVKRWSSRRE